MDMNFLPNTVGAACQQAAGKTVFVALAAVVVLTLAWAVASIASAGKTRAAR